MRRTCCRSGPLPDRASSGHVTDVTSGHVTSGHVTFGDVISGDVSFGSTPFPNYDGLQDHYHCNAHRVMMKNPIIF
jgi:hypothetical protein